jgi:hypothetical protein
MGDEREINPFFLPALILAAFLPVGFLCGGIVTFFDVYPLIVITSLAALVFSIVGLVIARKTDAPGTGCSFCLVLSLIDVLLVVSLSVYFSRPLHYHDHEHMGTIVPHTLSSEQIAERESINEIINHSIRSNTVTRTTK